MMTKTLEKCALGEPDRSRDVCQRMEKVSDSDEEKGQSEKTIEVLKIYGKIGDWGG